MTHKIIILTLPLIFLTPFLNGQEDYFQKAVEDFSHKKPTYIKLNNGEEIEGTIKKLNWKKGLFEEIKLETEGEKIKFGAEEIEYMYLPQSGLDKLGKAMNTIYDATEWKEKSNVNMDYIKDGYAYFESAEVQIKKKKTEVLLLQLVNPAFSNNIKVYHDPYAKETTGFGIAGIKVAGGVDKSYWVQKNGETAYKLEKKNLDDEAENLFGDCSDYYGSIKEDLKWKDIDDYIFHYEKNCE